MTCNLAPGDLQIVRRLTATDVAAAASPELARLLITDGLTGLYNRAYYQERIQMELAGVSDQNPLALLVIDLDRFKELNDRFGHRIGDLALQQVAEALRSISPSQAAPCRLGGDEFALLVPGIAVEVADWLRTTLIQAIGQRQIPSADGRVPPRLQASVGLAVAPFDGMDPETLFQKADAAMYAAKRGGGGETAPEVSWASVPVPLVGRKELLQALVSNVSALPSPKERFLLLSGPAGIGKSRLCKEVAQFAAREGMLVMKDECSGRAPLSAILEAADRLAYIIGRPATARLIRTDWAVRSLLRRTTPAETRSLELPGPYELAAGLGRLLREMRRRSPLLWVIEDIHAADATTRTILRGLIDFVADAPILILATARTGQDESNGAELSETDWSTFASSALYRHFAVPALNARATRQLVRYALGHAGSRAQIAHLAERSGGNPLLLLQALRSPVNPGESRDSLTLQTVFRSQFEELAEPTRNLLSAAAVLGSEFSQEQLLLIAPENPDNSHRSIAALIQHGWLIPFESRLRFSHPTARAIVYEATPPGLRRALHRLAGHSLVHVPGVNPADLARHFREGGDWVRAQSFYRTAGEAAEASFAYGEAAQHYREYIRLGEAVGAVPADAAHLALSAGDLFTRAEDLSSAIDMLQYALQQCRTQEERGLALVRMARAHAHREEFDQFRALNEQGISLLQEFGPSLELGNALMFQIHAQRETDLEELHRLVERVVAHAEAFGDPVCAMLWIAGCGLNLLHSGERDLARFCLSRAEQYWRTLPRQRSPRLIRALFNMASLAEFLADFGLALRAANRAFQWVSNTGDRQIHFSSGLLAAHLLVLAGNPRAGVEMLSQLERPVMGTANKLHQQNLLFSLIQGHLFSGHDEEAARLLPQLHMVVNGMDEVYAWATKGLEAQVRMAQGGSPDLGSLSSSVLNQIHFGNVGPAIYLNAATAQLSAGNFVDAELLVDTARRHPRFFPYQAPWLEWVQGHVSRAKGQREEALAAFRRAGKARGIGYYRALAHLDLATLLMEQAPCDVREIQSHLARARRLFETMGNRQMLERTTLLELAIRSERVAQAAAGLL